MFRANQKVVCVDDSGNRYLKNGGVYTVRSCAPHWNDGRVGVRLVEAMQHADVPFYASRFRPVVERKTDISALKALLNPTDEQVRVLAMTDLSIALADQHSGGHANSAREGV